MKVRFEHDECMLMAMYQKGSRRETAAEIHGILPHIADDRKMLALAVSTLEKMESISDAEFAGIDFEDCHMELMEGR